MCPGTIRIAARERNVRSRLQFYAYLQRHIEKNTTFEYFSLDGVVTGEFLSKHHRCGLIEAASRIPPGQAEG